MSIFRSITLLLGLAVAFTGQAQIDLTATAHEYMAEGIKYQELTFKEGKRTISMQLPNNWAYHSTADRLRLVPPKAEFSEGVIQAMPLAKPQPWDETAKKSLEQQVRGHLPPNSEEVTLKTRENLAPFGGNETLEVLVSYKAMGYAFQSSTLFVNCPESQLVFRFTAPQSQFEALNKTFRGAILSWQWLPAKEN
jgi:hypothetical protein